MDNMRPSQFFALLVAAASLTLAQIITRDEFHRRHLEAAKRFVPRATGAGIPKPQNITFSNPKASEFWVDGSAIPDVNFDIGDSWAGLLPISSDPNETRKLFFWFFPPGPEGSLDDLIFWTNGGPGCSSLEGLLQENGPFQWAPGADEPVVNVNSWTNLSSLLYVEQPVGTGYSQGVPNIKDENDLAVQLVGFFQQFLEVFAELKGKRFWLSGESYAGMYVPYVANYIYEHPTLLDLSLQGIWLSDASIGPPLLQVQIPSVGFVHKYEHVFSFPESFMAQIDNQSQACNYTGYSEKWATYPPVKGAFPSPGENIENNPNCNLWYSILDEAMSINPAFNGYHIFSTYPIPWDVLGSPGSLPDIQLRDPIYFNRTDVKKAIHAPLDVDWSLCSNVNVFPDGDSSLPSAFTVLPNVIEKSKQSVLVHGLGDFILIADGTRIVIQNMTWAGQQGFQTPIGDDNFVVDGVPLGNTHTERGLTYFEVVLSGHQVPEYTPVAAYQTMQYLLGRIDSPSTGSVQAVLRDEL